MYTLCGIFYLSWFRNSFADRSERFMTKKVLTSAFCVILLALNSNCGRQAQSSWVLDLSEIPNLTSLVGCPVRAWVHNPPGNIPPSPPNQPVMFYDSQSNQLLATVNSDNVGKASFTAHWGTNVVAKMS